MYEPETILELKNPRDPDDETGEEFPYNRVRVIGQSPVDHGGARGGDWSGAAGQGVIIAPVTNFGSNLDEPLGKLQSLYNVVSVPETIIEAPQVRVINSSSAAAGPTPEEVIAAEAPGEPSVDGERVRTPIGESPLEDPRVPVSSSPLDAPHPEATVTDALVVTDASEAQ